MNKFSSRPIVIETCVYITRIRKEKRDGNKDGWAREFEIEDQYSADRTKGSRPSRNVKTHARNADERELVHFPV